MGLYRLKHGSYGRHEDGRTVTYHANLKGRDIVELSDEDAAAMASRIEPVAPVAEAPVEPTEAERDAEVHATSIEDAVALIATIEDVEHLKSIAAREARNLKRKGGRKPVLKAVAERIAALAPPTE